MEGLPPPTKTPPFPIRTADQRAVLGVAITFAILPTIAVGLRILARRIAQRSLDASDYCIIIACIFAVALEGVSIAGVIRCGIGYGHLLDIVVEYGMEPVTNLFKLLIPLQFLWALSLGFSKISILLLYSAVFAVPVVIWTSRFAIVFIAMFSLATILTGIFICRPFAMNWDPTIPDGRCGDQVLSFTVTGVLNLITDVMVLVLPLPYLAKLQMRLYKKLVLLGVFSIGFLTCIVSAIRIHSLGTMDFNDITFSIPQANIFSGMEPAVAVTLACIPLLRPLLGRGGLSSEGASGNKYSGGRGTSSRSRSGIGGGGGGGASSSAPSKGGLELDETTGERRPFEPLTDDSSQYRLRPVGPKHLTEVCSGPKSRDTASTRASSDLESDDRGITVQSQWGVETGRV